MDLPTILPDGHRRFQTALAISLLAHAGIGAGGGLAAFHHGRRQRSALSEDLKKSSLDSGNPGGTMLIYVETTGPTFELPPSSSKGHSEGAGFSGRLPAPARPAALISSPRSPSGFALGNRARSGSQLPANHAPSRGLESEESAVGPSDAMADRAMQPYLEQLRAKLDQAIRASSAHHSSGMVLLHFVLDQRGNVKSAALVPQETPASAPLGQEALRGLRVAAPFPPLPASWSKNSASFLIKVHFQGSEVS